MALLTPQQLRERLVEFKRQAYRRAYGVDDQRAIERLVTAQLEYVDAAKRCAPAPRARKPAPPPRHAPDAARAMGAELREERGVPYRPALLDANPWLTDERWAAANARINRILQGASASTIAEAVKTSQVPRLAAKFWSVFASYYRRGLLPNNEPYTPEAASVLALRGWVDRNPFRHMSDEDALRMFRRKVEDICDESTRELGGWYVR